MRIIGLTGEGLANAEYRVALPLRALAQRGHVTEAYGCDPPNAIDGLMEQLRQADVIHVWRLYQAPVRRALRVLRDEGVAIVWDNDDDMTSLPPGFSTRGRYEVATDMLARELRDVMGLADGVTTTSTELARRFRRMGASAITVIDNYIGEATVRDSVRSSGESVVVGWVAGKEHRVDVKQLRLRSTLERVLQRNPNAQVVSIGLDLALRSERYRWVESVLLSEMTDAVQQFDIGLAPLAHISFNHGRSRVKLKEYAAGGVPWLASPVGPYRGLGEAEGGRLVPDPLWGGRLEELIGDDTARAALQRGARVWVRSQTIEENADKWEAVFETAHRRACARSGRPAPEPGGDRKSGVQGKSVDL